MPFYTPDFVHMNAVVQKDRSQTGATSLQALIVRNVFLYAVALSVLLFFFLKTPELNHFEVYAPTVDHIVYKTRDGLNGTIAKFKIFFLLKFKYSIPVFIGLKWTRDLCISLF